MMKKTMLIGALFAFVVGMSFAESNWHKIIFAGPEFSIVNQKVEKMANDKIDCHGIGINVEYLSAHKENGFAFTLKMADGIDWTDGITDDNDFGMYYNTFAGVGYAPLRTDKILLSLTGGIGVDLYSYHIDRSGMKFDVAGLDFLVGADVAFTYRLSKHVGIGVNVLGTFALGGVELIGTDKENGCKDDKDIESHGIGAGSFSIVPSIGVTVHF